MSRPVCAVIPALDEEATIATVVADVAAQVDEVIVVDNGSTDRTAAVAGAAGARVVREPRRGYGAACHAGALAADPAAILLYLDGDGSDDPAVLGHVLAPVASGRARLALGSRLRGRRGACGLAPHQAAANRAAAAVIRARWRVGVTDLGPVRAISRRDLLWLDMRSRTYGWPLEMILKAARARLPIEEVAVAARPRSGGRSKVSGSLTASARTAVRFGEAFLRYGLYRPTGRPRT
jgi:glycosyltransferase involved in cell wall biosynthesis